MKTLKKFKKWFRRNRKHSQNPFWKLTDLLTESCLAPYRFSLNHYYHFRYDSVLRNLIEGKKILIIGSGPSAKELPPIPDDVLIFSCKRALKIFSERGVHRPCDLYINWQRSMKLYPDTLSLLAKIKTNFFLIDEPRWAQHCDPLKGCYRHMIPYVPRDTYYLKRLLKTRSLNRLPGVKKKSTSVGVKLLQYALYFQAKEIYLIGMDLTTEGYFWGEPNIQKHLAIDHYFLTRISKQNRNIYSLSAQSPITSYFSHKLF